MSFVWDYESAFEVAYSTNITEEEKNLLFETLGIPEGLETIQEASSQVGFLVDFLDSIVFSEVSEATADELIDKVIGGLSEAVINEVSDEFIKRHARNAIADRKREFNAHKEPIGMVGLEKNAKAEERLNRAKELSKKAPERTFKSQPSSKLKSAVHKVKDWFTQANDHVGLSKVVDKKPEVKQTTPAPAPEPKKEGTNIIGAEEKKPETLKKYSSTISIKNKAKETKPEPKKEVKPEPVEAKTPKPRKKKEVKQEEVKAETIKPKRAPKKKEVKPEPVEAKDEQPKEEKIKVPVAKKKTPAKPKKVKKEEPILSDKDKKTAKEKTLKLVDKIRQAKAKKAEQTQAEQTQEEQPKEEKKAETPKPQTEQPKEEKKELSAVDKMRKKLERENAQRLKDQRRTLETLKERRTAMTSKPGYSPAELNDINQRIEKLEKEISAPANEALAEAVVLLIKSNISESSFVEVMKMIGPNRTNTIKIQERYEKELDEAIDEICKDAEAGNPVDVDKIKEAEDIEKRKEHFEEMLKKRFDAVN